MNVWLPVSPWIAALVAAGLSAGALALLWLGRAQLPQALPTVRSLHDRAVPRAGGLAIWAGFLPIALLAPPPGAPRLAWLAAWAAVTAVSIADDWRAVRPSVRLGVHATAALVASASILGGDAAPPSLSVAAAIALAALAVVWSANLYNFMDGNDGLAATMAICGFGAYGVAAWHAGVEAEAYFALAAATLPFLAVNLPPARVFMGDGGSVPMGFLAAVFGIAGAHAGVWPGWFPLLVFLPFVADATATVVRRLAAGANVFVAHRKHYYQRLHRMGAGHRGTLFFYGVLIAGTSASALATLATDPTAGWQVLGAWVAAVAALFVGIDYLWRRRLPSRR